jgi:hypothetical protein
VLPKVATIEEIKQKPNLSILALVSFIVSFIVARSFTILNPDTILLVGGDLHIHHFWYGLAMLATGGWLGISLENPRIDRVAAIIYGAGGGIIGDEIGLLLTFNDYWTSLTYTFIIVFLTSASILILLVRYQKTIRNEFTEFARSNFSLYFGVFVAAISLAFILETENILIMNASIGLAIMASIVITAYFIQRIRLRRKANAKSLRKR